MREEHDSSTLDVEGLLGIAEDMNQRELAELLSVVMEEMLEAGTSETEVLDACTSICRCIGVDIRSLRRCLH